MNKNPTIEEMAQLWTECQKFIEEYEISCPETIYQTDRVMIATPELVEIVCDIVGYVELEGEND